MRGYLWFWTGWLLAGAVFEVWAVWFRPADSDTLSEWFAATFRTGTVAGWWVLMALLGTVAVWFPGHTRRLALQRKERLKVIESGNEAAPRSGNS